MQRREFIAGLAGSAAWPLAARAQRPAVPIIAYLSLATESTSRTRQGEANTAAFRRGLGEQGYIEGRNVDILFRWAETQSERLPALVAGFVARRVAVIVTVAGAPSAMAAKAATSTIPIVFQLASDPVALGLVASLNRPGGNITGATFLASPLIAKRLELLHEAVPAATTIAYLVNPNTPNDGRTTDAEAAARVLGVRLLTLDARNASEIEAAFATIAQQRIGALLTDADSLFFGRVDQLVALAARYAVPAIYYGREFVVAGGLMSYGSDAKES